MLSYLVMKEYKGMRRFTPDEHRALAQVLSGWTSAAEGYGFLQYKTPLIDPLELYEGKTSEEIMSEQTYRFVDRGKRKVVLRPEITPGVSSMVVSLQKNRSLRLPFRAFSIGSVFRYERMQKGRSREHIQFNADLFGVSELWADAEVIDLAFSALEQIGFSKKDFVVRINDRAALTSTLAAFGVSKKMQPAVLQLLDRRDKMEPEAFGKQMEKLLPVPLSTFDAKLSVAPTSVRNLLSLLPKDISAEYSPYIVRGFDYYTGPVFEIYTKDPEVSSRSVAGGGRYDQLIASYGGDPVCAVGFGMGDVILLNCLSALSVPLPVFRTSIVVCTTADATDAALSVSRELREHFSVMFAGTLSTQKLGGLYKRYERMGARYVVDVHGKGDFSVRDLSVRETVPYSHVRALVQDIQSNTPSHESLPSNAGGSLLAHLKKVFTAFSRSS